jgi:hypothetical protein
MKWLIKPEECIGKTIKKVFYCYSYLFLQFDDDGYIFININDYGQLICDNDIDLVEQFECELITVEECEAELKRLEEENNKRQREIALDNFNYLKEKWGFK